LTVLIQVVLQKTASSLSYTSISDRDKPDMSGSGGTTDRPWIVPLVTASLWLLGNAFVTPTLWLLSNAFVVDKVGKLVELVILHTEIQTAESTKFV
jgi:hypothetical protein